MPKNHKRRPIIGPAFDIGRMDEAGRVESYLSELQWYRPAKRGALVKEGKKYLRQLSGRARPGFDLGQHICEWMEAVENKLTAWAQRVERHYYIYFGGTDHSGDVGFWISTDSAIEDADLTIDHGRSGPSEEMPRGFSGLLVEITDHGNVSAYQVSRGRKRELFAVV